MDTTAAAESDGSEQNESGMNARGYRKWAITGAALFLLLMGPCALRNSIEATSPDGRFTIIASSASEYAFGHALLFACGGGTNPPFYDRIHLRDNRTGETRMIMEHRMSSDVVEDRLQPQAVKWSSDSKLVTVDFRGALGYTSRWKYEVNGAGGYKSLSDFPETH